MIFVYFQLFSIKYLHFTCYAKTKGNLWNYFICKKKGGMQGANP